jgi:CotS family spore coat protein
MDHTLPSIIEQMYMCRVMRIRPKRTVWMCETDKGHWTLKGYETFDKAAWVTQLSGLLHARGFHDVVRYVNTIQEVPVFKWNGKYMTAMEKIPGREGRYFHRHDIIHSLQTLARFHSYSKGISEGPAPRLDEVPLLAKWKKRRDQFEEIVRGLQVTPQKNRLGKLILSASSSILNEADYTLQVAGASSLTWEYQLALMRQQIVHKDLASHNFIIGTARKAIIDLDTAAYDTPLVDIVQLISRALVQQGWDANLFYSAIEAYREIQPLTDSQVALIYLLLRFPDNFMREVNGLFERRKYFYSSRVESYISLIMRHWDNRQRFFDGYEHFIYSNPHRHVR